jgi:hypothetical protein
MNVTILRFAAAMSLGLFACACAGEVMVPSGTSDPPSGTGGDTGSSTGDGGGGSSSGSGVAAACVPQPEDPTFMQPTCADLAVMTVSDPSVQDDGGDGKVSPGEGAIIHVKLSEIAGKGFMYYPGVSFTSDTVTVPDPQAAQLYGILPCQVDDLTVHVVVPESVPKGTVVHVKAQVAMLSMACPDADSIEIPITVQ